MSCVAACAFEPHPASSTGPGPDAPAQALAFDAASQGAVTNGSAMTWAHTVGTTGLLLVGVSIEKQSGAIVSRITYGGVALIRVANVAGGGGIKAELWSLAAPELGSHDVAVTLSAAVGGDGAIGGAISFAGAHPTIGATATGGDTTGSPSTPLVAATAGDWIVDVIAIDNGKTATAGGAQVTRWDQRQGIGGFGSTLDPTASHVMSWSTSSDNWAQVVAEIDP